MRPLETLSLFLLFISLLFLFFDRKRSFFLIFLFLTITISILQYYIEGEIVDEMPASLEKYRKSKPVYKTLPGWGSLPEKVWEKGYDSLPQELKNYISFIENEVNCPVKIVSVGPQRHLTIIR